MGAIHLKENEVSIVKSTRDGNKNYRILNIDHPIFENEFILSIHHDKIVINRATIDSQNSRKVTRRDNTYYIIVRDELPLGRYLIDEEESNEDKLVIYLNN